MMYLLDGSMMCARPSAEAAKSNVSLIVAAWQRAHAQTAETSSLGSHRFLPAQLCISVLGRRVLSDGPTGTLERLESSAKR